MESISLDKALKETFYTVKDIKKSDSYLYKSLINIGFYTDKKIYIKDVMYHNSLTIIIINDIEYAIRTKDLTHIKVVPFKCPL